MAKVSIAYFAEYLGALHEEASISFRLNVVLRYRSPETWPSGSGIKLGGRIKELVAAANA